MPRITQRCPHWDTLLDAPGRQMPTLKMHQSPQGWVPSGLYLGSTRPDRGFGGDGGNALVRAYYPAHVTGYSARYRLLLGRWGRGEVAEWIPGLTIGGSKGLPDHILMRTFCCFFPTLPSTHLPSEGGVYLHFVSPGLCRAGSAFRPSVPLFVKTPPLR